MFTVYEWYRCTGLVYLYQNLTLLISLFFVIFQTTVTEFFSSTSAHGFAHLVNTSTSRKIFWLLFLLTAIGGLSYHFVTLMLEYYSYNVIESSSVSSEPPKFPWVTICPLNAHPYAYLTTLRKNDSSNYRSVYVKMEKRVRRSLFNQTVFIPFSEIACLMI